MKKILLILAAVCFSAVAQAQFVFSPGLAYETSDTTQSDPTSINGSSSGTIVDLRVGYILPMGLYLGGMYSLQSGSGSAASVSSDSKGNLIGPTVGYYSMMGFYTLLTYHILGETESTAAGNTDKYTGAKGPQVDLGWVFPLASSFAIGPQLTWKSIEFSNYEATNAAEVSSDYKRTTIQPYITLWFMF